MADMRDLRLVMRGKRIAMSNGQRWVEVDCATMRAGSAMNGTMAPTKAAIVLIALAAETGRGRFVHRDDLAEMIWPDADRMPELFWNGVRVRMYFLRRILKNLGLTIVCDYQSRYRLASCEANPAMAAAR